MVLSIEQLLLPFVAILLVMTMYFTFLRRIMSDAPTIRQRKRTLKAETPKVTRARTETVKPEAEPAESVKKEEIVSSPKSADTNDNEVKQETISQAPQVEIPAVKDKPRRKGLFGRAMRKSKPPPVPMRKDSVSGKVAFCPKYLGYLGTLPKGSPYPDQCLGCRKVVTCIGLQRGKAIESMYLEDDVPAS
jgi:hypothetical protein